MAETLRAAWISIGKDRQGTCPCHPPPQVAPPPSVLGRKAGEDTASSSRMSSFTAHLVDDDCQRVLELSQWSVEDREGILFIELYVGCPDELTTDTLPVVA